MSPGQPSAVDVRVGPPNRTIASDDEVFVCAPDGSVQPGREGYFCADTRIVSRLELTIGGAAPELLDSAEITPWSARFEYTNPELSWHGAALREHTLHLRVDRMLGRGMHEDLSVTNYGEGRITTRLSLRVEGDYRDILEVKAGHLPPKARPRTTTHGARMTTVYEVADFRRGLIVEAVAAPGTAWARGTTLNFELVLEPGQCWEACVLWRPIVGDLDPALPAHRCHDLLGAASEAGRRAREFRDSRTARVRTSDPTVDEMIDAAVRDLAALRVYRPIHAAEAERDADEPWLLAAGIPWFVAAFGRDALVAALQTLPVNPGIARGALAVLAELQATDDDPLHDAEPGKILHELRHGELAHFHRIPQTPYYGAQDAPALFVRAAARLWAWCGDGDEARRVAPAAERALAWADRYGDVDGDGLQEYRPRSGQWGYYNQSWKDAADAIMHSDGQLAPHPIATCELQGYLIAAKREWATVREAALGDGMGARRLRDEADRLAELLERQFWWEDEGTYYLALDGNKRPVQSVASNPGHLLWAGAVMPERAERVAHRLLEGDMWSGWGVRTLSARHPSFNPMSYQRGSVWPHDNAILVEGLLRYGLADEASTVARGVLDAGAAFQHRRLPELFAGFRRDDGGFPVQYLGANVPQAWASGAVIQLVTAFAGLAPDASAHRIQIRPQLPEWLSCLRLQGVRVGGAQADLVIGPNGVDVRAVEGDLTVSTG